MLSGITKVLKRDGSVEDFDQERIAQAIYRAAVDVGGHDLELARLVASEVVLFLQRTVDPDEYPTTEEIQDMIEKVLIERGHARTAKAFIVGRLDSASRGKTEAKHQRKALDKSRENIPFEKLWYRLVWNLDHGCDTLAKINTMVQNGTLGPAFMRLCDQNYETDVLMGAEKIAARVEDLKVVIVAGPSSSGKTTTTMILEQRLQEEGLRFRAINVDNYFFDLDLHPKDKFGDYDFETPQAIDMKLFNRNLRDLVDGMEVETPIYHFPTGKRLDETNPMKIEKDEIILIDCLHGLYPALTDGVPDSQKFRLYIETLNQQRDSSRRFIRWTDIRLLRRMVRDMQFRNWQPEQTLTHWHYVRRSELQHIIPNVPYADHIVNSALPYELPIQKHFLGDYFPGWVEKYRHDKERVDAFIRAERVMRLFDEIEAWDEIDVVSETALLREFIGGSARKYSEQHKE